MLLTPLIGGKTVRAALAEEPAAVAGVMPMEGRDALCSRARSSVAEGLCAQEFVLLLGRMTCL